MITNMVNPIRNLWFGNGVYSIHVYTCLQSILWSYWGWFSIEFTALLRLSPGNLSAGSRPAHHTSSLLAVWAPFNCCGEAYLGQWQLGVEVVVHKSTTDISGYLVFPTEHLPQSPTRLFRRTTASTAECISSNNFQWSLHLNTLWSVPALTSLHHCRLDLLSIHAAVFHRTCSLRTKYHPAIVPIPWTL